MNKYRNGVNMNLFNIIMQYRSYVCWNYAKKKVEHEL